MNTDRSKPKLFSRQQKVLRDFQKEIHDRLGAHPMHVLDCFIDLGLTDGEIARYFGLPEDCINILTCPQRSYGTQAASCERI